MPSLPVCANCQDGIIKNNEAYKCRQCHRLVHHECGGDIAGYCYDCLSGGNDN